MTTRCRRCNFPLPPEDLDAAGHCEACATVAARGRLTGTSAGRGQSGWMQRSYASDGACRGWQRITRRTRD
jgi:hypothetical protein